MSASLVLGTAGHIDHGKSALIKALTGTDPDRLAEEKARGITIELGFAQLTLPSGRSMGVVDVPGHEKFVRHMVAGATGIDVVLLVIAADDGVMPQTREHLAIIDLLGIQRGVVALTKSDLADDEWIELVTADVETLLAPTTIAGAPIVAVSSKTGAGLPELLAAIDDVATKAETDAARQRATMRLPVDRVFTIDGAGTVVTGTMWAGSIARDDQVVVYPTGVAARVRGVQVHSSAVDRAVAGQRVAVNLSGIDRDEIERGHVIATPGSLTPTDRFDARFIYLGFPGDDKPFETGARVHVHHGTREVLGRVLLMGEQELRPGQSAFAQVRLEEELAPRYEDRFVVRSYSPVYTIGGGAVLDVGPPRRTTLSAADRSMLEALAARDVPQAVAGVLATRAVPMTVAAIIESTGMDRSEVTAALEAAQSASLADTISVAGETYFAAPGVLAGLREAADRELQSFHDANPSATGMAVAALRDRVNRALPPKVFDAILRESVAAGTAAIEGGNARHIDAASAAVAQEESARNALVAILGAQGLSPAGVSELAAEAGVSADVARKVLTSLALDREVVRISSEMHFMRATIEQARATLTAYIESHGPSSAADLRDALGVSRKYAIPLLEYFDAQGLTRREGDLRVLRKG